MHFIITMSATELKKAEEQGFVEYFKLTSKISTANMIAFNFDGKITKYDSPEEIVEEFYPQRLMYYQKRKVREITYVSLRKETDALRRITWPTSSKSSCLA